MDLRVQKDTAPVHWVLDRKETIGFVGSLFNDRRLFQDLRVEETTVDSILDYFEEQKLWNVDRPEWQTCPDPAKNYSEENVARFFNRILDNLPESILCQR